MVTIPDDVAKRMAAAFRAAAVSDLRAVVARVERGES